nr:EOG090X0GYO [Triops cancriformis]
MVRHKNRYFLVEIQPQDAKIKDLEPFELKPYELMHAIQHFVEQIHGEFGVAAIQPGFQAKYSNAHTRIAVLRARHGPHKLLASTLPFVTSIGRRDILLQTLYTGATLHHCFVFLKNYHKKKLEEALKSARTSDERSELTKILTNLGHLDNAPITARENSRPLPVTPMES